GVPFFLAPTDSTSTVSFDSPITVSIASSATVSSGCASSVGGADFLPLFVGLVFFLSSILSTRTVSFDSSATVYFFSVVAVSVASTATVSKFSSATAVSVCVSSAGGADFLPLKDGFPFFLSSTLSTDSTTTESVDSSTTVTSDWARDEAALLTLKVGLSISSSSSFCSLNDLPLFFDTGVFSAPFGAGVATSGVFLGLPLLLSLVGVTSAPFGVSSPLRTRVFDSLFSLSGAGVSSSIFFLFLAQITCTSSFSSSATSHTVSSGEPYFPVLPSRPALINLYWLRSLRSC
ncbi:hypothetical protein PFISCL1PPCAC_24958, partial [Pristionchus fissidentatus]